MSLLILEWSRELPKKPLQLMELQQCFLGYQHENSMTGPYSSLTTCSLWLRTLRWLRLSRSLSYRMEMDWNKTDKPHHGDVRREPGGVGTKTTGGPVDLFSCDVLLLHDDHLYGNNDNTLVSLIHQDNSWIFLWNHDSELLMLNQTVFPLTVSRLCKNFQFW